jgi:hypothetical protein
MIGIRVRSHFRLIGLITESVLDDFQRKEVLALLSQYPPQAFHVLFVELPVTRRCPLGIDKPLALQEPDLRDGDVGELLPEQGEDVTYRKVRPPAHLALPLRFAPARTVIRPSPPNTTT